MPPQRHRPTLVVPAQAPPQVRYQQPPNPVHIIFNEDYMADDYEEPCDTMPLATDPRVVYMQNNGAYDTFRVWP